MSAFYEVIEDMAERAYHGAPELLEDARAAIAEHEREHARLIHPSAAAAADFPTGPPAPGSGASIPGTAGTPGAPAEDPTAGGAADGQA